MHLSGPLEALDVLEVLEVLGVLDFCCLSPQLAAPAGVYARHPLNLASSATIYQGFRFVPVSWSHVFDVFLYLGYFRATFCHLLF
mgnify:CR=1 FL=1